MQSCSLRLYSSRHRSEICRLRQQQWVAFHTAGFTTIFKLIQSNRYQILHMGKRLPQLYYIKLKISLIGILLQSESPWQRNDAITFFIYLCVSLYKAFFFFFLTNCLRVYVPAIIASIMAKFEQILRERFQNILKRRFKHHKNSEIACYPHN